jgi:adenine-specific DNA-methyltransferase
VSQSLDKQEFKMDNKQENKNFLSEQIITYIGNKRALLSFIEEGLHVVQKKLGKTKLDIFDVFSGSGITARRFKMYADLLIVNDLEKYSKTINECYLSNVSDIDIQHLTKMYNELKTELNSKPHSCGIITELYAPKNDESIEAGDRVFYTRQNAMYIDTARSAIEKIPQADQCYFLAPLFSQASVHANTSGVFKGFYKNKLTGTGQFGGSKQDALSRITGSIDLPFPVFSNFNCDVIVYNSDSNKLVNEVQEVDLAYLDPPYNQHPYGSNYFMLNLILENKHPVNISAVSGIPKDWNRSVYNKRQHALEALTNLIKNIKAKIIMISFNSEGFISPHEMILMLNKIGKTNILETEYNTFRGSRNLNSRPLHVKEYLYILEK